MTSGDDLPQVRTEVPGPGSRALVDVLARHECPAVTTRRARRASALGAADDDPIVWRGASGALVEDVDGNRFVDLTSGFGVALVGHRHPAVVAAATAQSEVLVHAMGDAWPDATRIRLLQRLAAVAPPGLEVAILGLSGSDAVDAAVKTAVLATGRAGVLVFDGGYHGLALGVLGLQSYKESFRAPFADIVHPRVTRLPFGGPLGPARDLLGQGDVGLVLVEPILGRGGVVVPPSGWLGELAAAARGAGALVAFDEVQTGIGRTGAWFRATAEAVVPDLLCAGKALGGGWPLSACLGTRAAMDAWGAATGESLHTQTFLGHPVGCAAALAVLDLLEQGLLAAVTPRGASLADALTSAGWRVRGVGLLRAVEVGADALKVSRALLRAGFLTLPAGPTSIGLTPPVCLSDAQIEALVRALGAAARAS